MIYMMNIYMMSDIHELAIGILASAGRPLQIERCQNSKSLFSNLIYSVPICWTGSIEFHLQDLAYAEKGKVTPISRNERDGFGDWPLGSRVQHLIPHCKEVLFLERKKTSQNVKRCT